MISSSEAPIDMFSERPIIEQFPALHPLRQLDGKGFVRCHAGEDELLVTSLAYDPLKGLYGGKQHYVFGAFSIEGLSPVAICQYSQYDSRVACSIFNSVAFTEAEPFGLVVNLPNIFQKHSREVYEGFFVGKDRRRRGIGQLMLACSMLVLESLGYKEIVFFGDQTADWRSYEEGLSSPVQMDGIERRSKTGGKWVSFYTKLSKGGRVQPDPTGYINTHLPTRISTKQAELIQKSIYAKRTIEFTIDSFLSKSPSY